MDSTSKKMPQQAKRYVVAAAEELASGQRKIVKVDRREIGIFNINGEYFALRNVCPHKGAPVCKGRQRPLIVSTGVNRVVYEREGEIIKCPWHLWEFDIKTGRAMHDENVGVRTYSACREGDDVVVYLD